MGKNESVLMSYEQMHTDIHTILDTMVRLRNYTRMKFGVDMHDKDGVFGHNVGAAMANGDLAYEAFLNYSINLVNLAQMHKMRGEK